MSDDTPIPAGAHEDVLRWLSRDLDRELPERERILLSDHLDGCHRCARIATQLRAAERTVRADTGARPPVALVDRILARIAREDSNPDALPEAAPVGASARGGSLLRMLRASAAIAAGFLVLVGSVYVAQGPKQAIAGTSPTLKSDPEMMRVLERWQKGHAAPPSYFELLLAPARRDTQKSR